MDYSSYFDFEFKCHTHDRILWIISDFGQHYQSLLPLQQERNEQAIKSEILELQQKNLSLEKKLLEYKNSELERIQHAKTTFYAQVSHEMRTPLQNIIGLVNILFHQAIPQQTEYIEALKTTAQHLTSVVNDVLELSGVESGKLTLESVPFHLYDTVNNTINAFRHICKEKKLTLSMDIDPGLPVWLLGDATRLAQVLYNLVGNAVKFTEKGYVNVQIRQIAKREQAVKIDFAVEDSGIGISAEQLENVFLPYMQGDEHIKSQYGGSGLGLSIVKQIIEMQKGVITIESEVQHGSKVSFQLTFPWIDEPDVTKTEGITFQHIKKVLIGEDDAMQRKNTAATVAALWNRNYVGQKRAAGFIHFASTDLRSFDHRRPHA